MQTKSKQDLVGIGFMLLAVFIFVSINAAARDVLPKYSILQIVFFRNFFALIPTLALVHKAGGIASLKTNHMGRYLLVGIAGLAAFIGLFKSLALLPLAEAVTIHFSETLMVTAMAALYLKEKVGIHRWSAVLIGFAGVMVMLQPSADIINVGIMYALLFAVGDAFFMINARILTRNDSSATVVFYFAVIVSILSGLALPFVWQTPTFADGIILIMMGICGGLGQICLTQAYKYADASTVTPMIYTALIWSVLFGYLFWGEVPDAKLILGGALIVGGGLYVVIRETRQQ